LRNFVERLSSKQILFGR